VPSTILIASIVADSATATGLKWDTPASGGVTLLATHTLSGSTSTISTINQNYNSIFFVAFGVTNSVDAQIECSPNANTTGADYTGVAHGTATQYLNAKIQLSGGFDVKAADTNNVYFCQLFNYASSTAFKPLIANGRYVRPDNVIRTANWQGAFKDTTAISSLQFQPSSGSFNGGTVLLYGVK
jgi:L-fucose isomerase-like protein